MRFLKKQNGLCFLSTYFEKNTINYEIIKNESDACVFLKNRSLSCEKQYVRIRCTNPFGNEFGLPMGTFYDEDSVREFIRRIKLKYPNYEFIFHMIDDNFYYPQFCGTVAVFNGDDNQRILIEFQYVNKEMIKKMDSGKRPRDWDICLSLQYVFLHPVPSILYKDVTLSIEILKRHISMLFDIGKKIYDIYEKKKKIGGSYTRFNICRNDEIVLFDHRC